MYRVEDKYVIPANDYAELKARVQAVMPPDRFSTADRGYTISSLYFDDIADTDYVDAVSGNPHRQKHRIRIYNNALDTIKLEVKHKAYSRIAKASRAITPAQMYDLMNGETIDWGDSRDDPRTVFNACLLEKHLMPKVIVTYERQAFVWEAGNVRITFDQNIRASDAVAHFGEANLTYDYPDAPNAVLEVKYDEFCPDFILQILETDSMQQISYSKYRICRDIYMRGN